MSDKAKTPIGNSTMDKEPQHKHSLERDAEIAAEIDEALKNGTFVRPALIIPGALSGKNFSSWINNAFIQAQLDKDRFLGRETPNVEKQPNPAISTHQQRWLLSMNNKRELGPGDVKK